MANAWFWRRSASAETASNAPSETFIANAPVRAVAVGADDDFDRAFDDIMGAGKLP